MLRHVSVCELDQRQHRQSRRHLQCQGVAPAGCTVLARRRTLGEGRRIVCTLIEDPREGGSRRQSWGESLLVGRG